MEGRVPPAVADPKNNNLPLPLPPRSPPSDRPPPSETYIVQIPRDQIYRIPPPENARIVESYRSPENNKDRCGNKRFLWILISIAILATIVGVTIAIIHAFFSPKPPEFSVTKVLVKAPPTSRNKNAKPSYQISLKANNPNEKMGVSYEDGGETSLSFRQKKIADGKFPPSSQDAKESTTIPLTLAGSNAALPSEVEKSMKKTMLKTPPVSLSLTINVPVKLKGLVEMSKDLTVTCEFKVSTLASGTQVSHQSCDSKF